jgi:hypothetical protein
MRDEEKAKDRKQKIEIVTDQIYTWAQRVIQKMSGELDIDIPNLNDLEKMKKATSIIELFDKITQQTCHSLENIIQEEGEDESRYITSKDFMNDFASDEFLNKNIRVRPVSGRTNAEDTRYDPFGSNAPSRNVIMGTENTDDEENYNKMLKLEMEDQRKNIKVKVRSY